MCMSTTTNTADAYLKTRVLTTRPEQLRLMLLDGAIKFARQGLAGLETKDFEASYEGFSQSRAIVMELIVTIEPTADPELAARVKSVLSYIFSEMVEASMNRDAVRMAEPIRLLEYERETWAMFIEKLAKQRSESDEPDAMSERKPDAAARTISVEA